MPAVRRKRGSLNPFPRLPQSSGLHSLGRFFENGQSGWLFLRLVALFLCGMPPSPLAGSHTHDLLLTAAEVRALPVEKARAPNAVQLRGIYMGGADPEGIAFVLQDETEGIYVQAPPNLLVGMQRGDLLEVLGVTDPGGYAPYVLADEVRRIGRRPIPEPIAVTLDELHSGQMDAQWVEVTGIVRSVEPTAPSDSAPPPPGTRFTPFTSALTENRSREVKVKLAAGSARVMVEMSDAFDPEALVDAEVRIRALCFNLHNRNRQFVKPFLQVPEGVRIEIQKPPPKNPYDGPALPLSNLFRFGENSTDQGHRVHLQGVVVHHQPGSVLWLRDGNHSLRVETTQVEELRPGDQIDVLGFSRPAEYSPVIEDAQFRKIDSKPAPLPTVLTDFSSALRNDANLVQLEARLIEVRHFPDRMELTLEWLGRPIRGHLHMREQTRYPSSWTPGSIVRVSGICTVEADGPGPLGGLWVPSQFQLLLRSADDLAVVRPPPWWNAERIVWILSAFLTLAIGSIAGIMWLSRRRLKEQMHRRSMAEAEFSAILRERNRLAREIHDTLSQSLGAISVHLELARSHANELGEDIRHNLGTAHKLARAALAEARTSIWNMRSQVLEECDLSEALRRILRQLTDDSNVLAGVTVEGIPRRLSPMVENDLLRIGQEAINNAAKHARPGRIDLTLSYEKRLIRLSVEDDGAGFLAETPAAQGRRSFGLVGIRERAELLGGTVDIQSAPGEGTRVTVSIAD